MTSAAVVAVALAIGVPVDHMPTRAEWITLDAVMIVIVIVAIMIVRMIRKVPVDHG